jgi:AcrR family transcriptional regulator
VATRSYRLGKRQASADHTRYRILQAARELVASGGVPSVGSVAHRAGVSRITVYNRFGSRSGLMNAVGRQAEAPPLPTEGNAREQLRQCLIQSCSRWSANPSLFRHLPAAHHESTEVARQLAERLAAEDQLRPGCSIKEAEDVIGVLGSFPVFDHLHHDGRRAPVAVAEILMRLAAGILA